MKVFEQQPGSRRSIKDERTLIFRQVACDHFRLHIEHDSVRCLKCGQIWQNYDNIQPALNQSRPVEDITNV